MQNQIVWKFGGSFVANGDQISFRFGFQNDYADSALKSMCARLLK